MSQVASHAESPPTSVDLRVSTYDRAAGVLVALLIILGMFVFVLFLLWLARTAISDHPSPPVEVLQPFGPGINAEGAARGMEEPGVEEFAEVSRPQLADTLAAVTTTVTAQPATLDEMLGDENEVGRGRGQGDNRGAGDGGDGDPEIIPRWDRWQINFTSSRLAAYSRQLDFFGVELGALGGGSDTINYARNFSAAKPETRQVDEGGDNRLNFYEPTGETAEFDRQLMAKAGIDVGNRVVLEFYSKSVENQLAVLERERAGDRPLKEIRKTVFAVQSNGEGYEFVVVRQEYRNL